ncbi:prephenate dehydratase domain-containing protein [Acetobacter estunensis]|nr:prephenate dehydratase domain-containing protein [Acetobacter estunensis]
MKPYKVSHVRDKESGFFLSSGRLLQSKAHYRSVMSFSAIGYLGPCGSFSELACENAAPETPRIPFTTFGDICRALFSGIIEAAIYPIYNSTIGWIAETQGFRACTEICELARWRQRIELCLIGAIASELPKIKRVVSHRAALEQSRNWIFAHHFSTQETTSTAAAMQLVLSDCTKMTGAIGSRRMALNNDAKILAVGIEDSNRNYTDFSISRLLS